MSELWTCDACGDSNADEHADCSCDDDCTEHIETIKRLNAARDAALRERDEGLDRMTIDRDTIESLFKQRDEARVECARWKAEVSEYGDTASQLLGQRNAMQLVVEAAIEWAPSVRARANHARMPLKELRLYRAALAYRKSKEPK